MARFSESALSRGLVIESSDIVADCLRPIVISALKHRHSEDDDNTAIMKENIRLQKRADNSRALSVPAASWEFNTIASRIRDENLAYSFQEVLGLNRTTLLNFQEIVNKIKDGRNQFAHPATRFATEAITILKLCNRLLAELDHSKDSIEDFIRQLESLNEHKFGQLVSFFDKDHPSHIDDLNNATRLAITGTNMRRFVTDNDTGILNTILARRDGHVKILMHHPNDSVLKYANIQEGGAGSDPVEYKKTC